MSTSDQQEHGPLTRKQLREIRLTGSTAVITAEEAAAVAAAAPPVPPLPRVAAPVEISQAPIDDVHTESGEARLTRRQVREQERVRTASVPVVNVEDADAVDAPAIADEPEPAEELETVVDEFDAEPADEDEEDEEDAIAAVAALGIEVDPQDDDGSVDDGDVLVDVHSDDSDVVGDERPTVSSAFGQGVLSDSAEAQKPFTPSFDELLSVGDSTGSQHLSPNMLIFNPSPGEGSLSGPVASTGEILVTGSYDLPPGLGSQGHAHGTTDGKDVDAVLIDGELAPASSPTPIAASSAISTLKPAGEVIRPPVPEKGNKLMLILAIVAGGLALALGVALIVAFTTNVF